MEKTVILLPVFNDWSALERLLEELESLIDPSSYPDHQFLIINDGSFDSAPPLKTSIPLTVLHLTHNMGHQKAIAIGLSCIHHHIPCTKVLVMDADGDDRPQDALKLMTSAKNHKDKIIVGWRTQRQDAFIKKLFYGVYLALFRLFVGKNIRFGNFCIIPFQHIKRLVYKGDIWNHLPGGIIKSNLPYTTTYTIKGQRYDGNSKMSFASLVYHAISAITAFIDVIAIRLLIASALAIAVSLLALLVIFIIRISTDLAIPGWASGLAASIIIIILLSFLIGLFLIFTFMISQSYRKFIPALHYKEFIENLEAISE